jgi:hypothetical protein
LLHCANLPARTVYSVFVLLMRVTAAPSAADLSLQQTNHHFSQLVVLLQ